MWEYHDTSFGDNFPDSDRLVLVNFSNFSEPMLGRWYDNNWHIGDMEETFLESNLYVDGWWELPEKPKGGE